MLNEKTNYTSWSTQNDLINISAQIIKNTIIKEMTESGFFSVMCDEARQYILILKLICCKIYVSS